MFELFVSLNGHSFPERWMLKGFFVFIKTLRKYTSTFNEIYDDYIHVFHVMIISLISLKHCNNSYACLICLETHYGLVVWY